MTPDNYAGYRGRVRLREHGDSDSVRVLVDKNNVVSFFAGDVLAAAVCGDLRHIPKYVGFLYGGSASPPSLENPSTLLGATRRLWTKALLADVCADNSANIAYAPFAARPSTRLADDQDPELYTANTATFVAHTGMVAGQLFSGGSYADPLDSLGTAYVYQAVLLGLDRDQVLQPFAIVQVESAPFVAISAERDYSIVWDITFN